MSDPVDEFEKKLKKMSLSELHAYKKLLDERIKEKISEDVSNEKIAHSYYTEAYFSTKSNQETF